MISCNIFKFKYSPSWCYKLAWLTFL